MAGALTGFATIGVLIAVGALVAHLRLFDLGAQAVLSRLAFFVASPCLMVLTIGDSDVRSVLSANLVASAASVVVAYGAAVLIGRLRWGMDAADATITGLSVSYVNAGNLGIPITAYVVGDASLVAPTLLMQLLVIAPLSLMVLDRPGR